MEPDSSSQMPVQSQKTNTFAILGLVFAFLLAPLGLIFSIISLSQIKKSGESGRGVAIAGIIVSSVFILIFILFMVLGIGLFMAKKTIVNQDVTVLSSETPTLDNPLTIATDVKMKLNKYRRVNLGFYAKNDYQTVDFFISECTDTATSEKTFFPKNSADEGKLITDPVKITCQTNERLPCSHPPARLPIITSASVSSNQGESWNISAVLFLKAIISPSGNYVCKLVALDMEPLDMDQENAIVESTSFRLTVTE
jgi:hypothetical protein